MKVARIRPISRRNPRQGADLKSGTPDVTCRRALIRCVEAEPRTLHPCRGAAAESTDLPPGSGARMEKLAPDRDENPHALPEIAQLGRHSPPARQSRSSTPASRPASLWPPRYRGARPEAPQCASAPSSIFATSHRGGEQWCRYLSKGRRAERGPRAAPVVAERPLR